MSPRIRQSVYFLGTIVSGILGIALLFHGVSADAAGNINSMSAGLVALLGGSAPAALAAHNVSKQRADGTLDFTGTPAEQAIAAIQATAQAAAAATNNLDKVKNAVSDVFGTIPVVGPLAQQVINAVKLP